MPRAPWSPADTFGARLRAERGRLGFSVRELAAAVDAFGPGGPRYDGPTVSRWHGSSGPRLDALAFLGALGFDVHWLVTGQPNHAHHLGATDGLGESRVPLSQLYGADGAPRWPVPITWTPHDVRSAAALHALADRRGVITPADVAAAFAPRAVARITAAAQPVDVHAPGTARRLAALANAWTSTFCLATRCTAPLDGFALASVALAALERAQAPRAA